MSNTRSVASVALSEAVSRRLVSTPVPSGVGGGSGSVTGGASVTNGVVVGFWGTVVTWVDVSGTPVSEVALLSPDVIEVTAETQPASVLIKIANIKRSEKCRIDISVCYHFANSIAEFAEKVNRSRNNPNESDVFFKNAIDKMVKLCYTCFVL